MDVKKKLELGKEIGTEELMEFVEKNSFDPIQRLLLAELKKAYHQIKDMQDIITKV